MTSPTGKQYEITLGTQKAVVTEVGATLRVYAVAGNDVVSGFAVEEVVHGGRGMQLLPWPNRIRDGRYLFLGETQQLSLSEPKRQNAIHGLARHVAWTVTEHTDDAITQQVRIYPQPGWPGTIEAQITHQLTSRGLTVTVKATNIGDTEVPYGYAAHPYLTVGETQVDDIAVTLPADSYLEVDDRLLPVRLLPVDDRPEDLRGGDPLGDRVLDTAYTDLNRDEDGRWRVRLSRGDRHAELWGDTAMTWAQVFTGEHRRDIALAVEPMTCGPDAFNEGPTHDGMVVIEPGKTFTARWGLSGS